MLPKLLINFVLGLSNVDPERLHNILYVILWGQPDVLLPWSSMEIFATKFNSMCFPIHFCIYQGRKIITPLL